MDMEIFLNGEKVRLNGKADYSLWYGCYGEMECNVAIVEAKRIGLNSEGVIQCQAYMCKSLEIPRSFVFQIFIEKLAIIHKARKRTGREDNTVYGIATDGENFDFMRITTDRLTGNTVVSQSEHRLLFGGMEYTDTAQLTRQAAIWGPRKEQKEYVVALLRRVYREACSLPATRPGSIARGQSVAKRQKVSISEKEGNAIDTDQH